jgi:Mn2+/Fe2+ NRAMP family transporter
LALALLAYPLTAVVVSKSWGEMLVFSLLPQIIPTHGFLYLVTGILGAGISPYMYLWQASEEVEEEKALGCVDENGAIEKPVRPPYISRIRWDTALGMLASLFSAWCIVVVAQSVFHRSGIFEIRTAAEAASALEPLVSAFPHSGLIAQSIFSAGIIGLGLLAVPVMAGSAAYATAEMFNWREGLSLRYNKAKGFYGVIVAATLTGFALNLFEFNPIKALVFASVFNGFSTGPLLLLIYLIGRNRKIMGQYRSGAVSAFLLILTILAALASALFLISSMALS